MTLNCLETRERLSAYSDDELDPVASRQVTEHVRSCPGCASELEAIGALRERLRDALEYHRAPDLLRARITAAAKGPAERPKRSQAPAWRWVLAAAAGFLIVSGGWLADTRMVIDPMAREVVSGHIRSLMANHLTDVASTDQHTVKPWFNGRIDYAPPVVDFAPEGYPLVGGRLDYMANGPVAALVYERRKHVINVYVSPEAGDRERVAPARSDRGFHLIHATHGHMSYWIVSDLNTAELTAFARLLTGPEPVR